MLWSVIFMRTQIDNATAGQQSLTTGLPERSVTRPLGLPRPSLASLQSLTLSTLAGHASSVQIDGHAVPSIFAATPSASTKVEKLMDTLFSTGRHTFALFSTAFSSGLFRFGAYSPLVTRHCILTRYTCRERKRLFSCRINNIAKIISIHF